MRSRRLILLAIAVALFAGACSSSPDEGALADDDSGVNEVSVDVEGSADVVEDAGPPLVPGAPLNPFDLRAGQCYNEGSWFDEERERRIELTASIGCDQPHQREVFFESEFPAPNGAPFPGDVAMDEWSTELCYTAFEDFVGLEYELSQYEIGFIHPTEATFEHEVGRHRRVTCVLFDLAGDELVGSARNSGL